MTWRRRLVDGLTIAVGAAMVAALVHIVAILIIPLYATRDAFARVSELGPVNQTIALPRASPGERSIPYGDPAVASAVCHFDLGSGPLRVKAPADGSQFVSLSFHTRRGGVFFALNDRAATRGVLDALVVTEEQSRALAAKDDEDEPVRDLRIVSATATGFVVIRALSEEPSLYPRAELAVRSLSCVNEAQP